MDLLSFHPARVRVLLFNKRYYACGAKTAINFVVIAANEPEHCVERRQLTGEKIGVQLMTGKRSSKSSVPKAKPKRVPRSQCNMVRKESAGPRKGGENRRNRPRFCKGHLKKSGNLKFRKRSNKAKKPVPTRIRLDRTRFLEADNLEIATLNVWGLRSKGKCEDLQQF